MIIEFHSSSGAGVSMIKSIKNRVLAFSHIQKCISRAEIFFREDMSALKKDKVCEVRLVIADESLFVHRRASGYEKAVREALDELDRQLQELAARGGKLPVTILTTVKHAD